MLSMNNAICHQADICVIGGGMAGMIAAISARAPMVPGWC